MKAQLLKLSITFIAFFVLANCKAAIIMAIKNNGAWTNGSTWDLNRLPMLDDTIIIPAGIEVKIQENINLELSNSETNSIYLMIAGVLNFQNSKFLNLPLNSSIHLMQKSTIRFSKTKSFISLHLEKICSGNLGVISGPANFGQIRSVEENINNFEIINSDNSFLVSWGLKPGFENGYYELQVSEDGLKWETLLQKKIIFDSVEMKYQYIFKSNNKRFFIKLDSYDLKGRKNTLATTNFRKKKNYEKMKTILPKMLIGATLMTFLNHLKFIK